jgi:hypothetical protein
LQAVAAAPRPRRSQKWSDPERPLTDCDTFSQDGADNQVC